MDARGSACFECTARASVLSSAGASKFGDVLTLWRVTDGMAIRASVNEQRMQRFVGARTNELAGTQSSTNLPSLKDQGIEQLYPAELENSTSGSGPSKPSGHAYYLLKISKSLLLNFLELVGVLSICPEQSSTKLEDIRNLFINAHHLINLYRPHQARESLILMMEEQLQRAKNEIREMDRVKEKVENFLKELEAEGREVVTVDSATETAGKAIESGNDQGEVKTRERETRMMWELLDGFEEG